MPTPSRDAWRHQSHTVGRWAEEASVRRALAEGHRLIVLVGPAGAGKTTLAARLFGRGSIWCELERVREIDGMCTALAQSLALAQGSSTTDDATVRIGRRLAE